MLARGPVGLIRTSLFLMYDYENAAGNLAFVDWAVPPAACMVPPLAICLDGQKSTSATPPIDGISRPTFERVCSRPMRRECQMEDSLRLNKFDLQRGCVS
jgi:hypothetical protein